MPEGMRAGGKRVLVQAPPPHRGLYIWQAMTWQATLDLEAIDSAARCSALFPVPEFGPVPQGMSLLLLLCQLSRSMS
jgi:hypothetical protein